MRQLVMLDLFSGLGGASQAMRERGWKVIEVERNLKLSPTVYGDVTSLPLRPFPCDLIWASPPCEMYATKYQFRAWYLTNHKREPPDPDLRPWQATLQIIEQWQPRYWVIENVLSAQKVWGRAPVHFGSRYLWTNLPMIGQLDRKPIKIGSLAGKSYSNIKRDPDVYLLRSKIEYTVSLAVCCAVEMLCENAA